MMSNQPTPSSLPFVPILMACIGGILLGFSPIFVRFSDLGPMATGFYRMLFALPFLWIWMYFEERSISKGKTQGCTRSDYLIMLGAGLFFALDLGLWNWSLDYTAIVNATLFNNTAAFFVPLLLWVIFREKQPRRFLGAALFGFFGCVLLVGESFSVSLKNLAGDFASLGSGLMVALYVITIKKTRDRLKTGMLMVWTGIAALGGMGLLGVLFQESFWPLTDHDILSILGQALLVHAAGQGLLAYAMGKIPASSGALIMLLAPVTAAILGWICYEESLSMTKILGMIIVMGSIVVVRQNKPFRILGYLSFLRSRSVQSE